MKNPGEVLHPSLFLCLSAKHQRGHYKPLRHRSPYSRQSTASPLDSFYQRPPHSPQEVQNHENRHIESFYPRPFTACSGPDSSMPDTLVRFY